MSNFWEQDEVVSAPAAVASPTAAVPSSAPASNETAAAGPVDQTAQRRAAFGRAMGTPAAQPQVEEPTPAATTMSAASVQPMPAGFTPNRPAAKDAPAAPGLGFSKERRSAISEVGHQLGLTARMGINTVAALPAMAADAVAAPINAGLDAVRGPGVGFRFPRQAQALDQAMDGLGFAQPETRQERLVQDIGAGVGAAATGIGIGGLLARSGGPLAQAAGRVLQQGPGMQIASGAASGAAQGAVREGGGGAVAQTAASVAGALLPGAATAPFRTVANPARAQVAAAAKSAHEAGYVIPPADLSPGLIGEVASAVSGKVKTAQEASSRNQSRSNDLARSALGLTPNQPLNVETLAGIRREAAQAYEPVASSGMVTPSASYTAALDDAVKTFTSQAKSFPGMPAPPVVGHIEALKTGQFDAGDGLNAIKVLRNAADAAYRSGDSLVGGAYKKGAGALEQALEDHLVSLGTPAADLLKAYRGARQTIAKTYTIESALNLQTGNVNAIKLANDLRKGKPLTGDLRTVAEAGQAFPKAVQHLKEAPKQLSVMDVGASLLAATTTGNPAALAGLAARPVVRNALLSKFVQAQAVKNSGTTPAPVPAGASAIAVETAARASTPDQPANEWWANDEIVQPTQENWWSKDEVVAPAPGSAGQVAPTSPSPASEPVNAQEETPPAAQPAPEAAGAQAPAPAGSAAGAGTPAGEPARTGPVAPAGLSPLDAAAHEAATSPMNDRPEPTPAQVASGNYRKGHARVQGLDITIENPKGSVRRGIDPEGKEWKSTLASHYGYVRGTKGNDGDHVDVFIGPNPESRKVYVVDQLHAGGGFDEHKSLLGFDSLEDAKAGYLANYTPGWKGLGAITELPMAAFKAWVASGHLKEPLAS